MKEIEFKIKGLMMDPLTNSPIVVLQDTGSDTLLPIWVGIFEANAIALQIEKVDTPRPMTHDLMKGLLNHLSIQVIQQSLHQIVRHGSRRIDLLYLQCDRVGFENANPNWEQGITGSILQDDNRRIGQRIHHQAFDLKFYFFHFSSPESSEPKLLLGCWRRRRSLPLRQICRRGIPARRS